MDKLVRPAFAQRRKVLTNTLPGVARADGPLTREDVRAALEAFGLAPAARPEELSPSQWVAFARRLDWLPE
jgi:16S rRNA A1518/A1519 N6-dimethyltransferase RsmA/KsgA/DIM1 with predicted DNA glycosylase/AP lyase activity